MNTEDSPQQIINFQKRMQKGNNYAVHFLLAAISVLFLLEELWGGSNYSPTLVRLGANSRDLVLAGEYWRVVTSVFLHGGYLHIFFNGYVLIVLGIFINRIFGSERFLNLFLLSGIAGSVASVLIGKSALSVGASGALWGLFGASAALSIRPSPFLPESIRLRIRRITLINIVLNLGISFLPMIDIWAHLGGGIGGFLLGVIYVYQENEKTSGSLFEKSLKLPLTVILTLIVLYSFSQVGLKEHPWKLKEPLTFNSVYVSELNRSVVVPTILTDRQVQGHGNGQYFRAGKFPFDPLVLLVETNKLNTGKLSSKRQKEMLKEAMRMRTSSMGFKQDGALETIENRGQVAVWTKNRLKDHREVYLFISISLEEVIEVEVWVMPKTPVVLKHSIPSLFNAYLTQGQTA